MGDLALLSLDEVSETEIKEWVAASRKSPQHDHAVYVLDCTPLPESQRGFRIREFINHAEDKADENRKLDKMEQAAYAASQGNRVYYVGYTSDVPDRLSRHLKGAAAGGARFTNLFDPRALVQVLWYRTAQSARDHEPKIATDLSSEDGVFAYWE